MKAFLHKTCGPLLAGILLAPIAGGAALIAQVKVITVKKATPRELYGAQQLRAALSEVQDAPSGARVIAGVSSAGELERFHLPAFWPQAEEAFLIRQVGNAWVVAGSDP
ncbi:MAG: hypothetical protein ACLGQX_11100, partial [Acidobacteriota bacterium]